MDKMRDRLSGSFRWLNATQFFGALNDHIFRWLIVLALIQLLGEEKTGIITSTVGLVFVLPFLLFTPLAGKLADRFSKRDITVWTKGAEVAVMVLGIAAFWMQAAWPVYVVLFLMCSQSAFFGPSKYGIVPELVKTEQLSRANSYIEALTYGSVVIGTAVAPALSQVTDRHYAVAQIACLGIAVAGFFTSTRIGRTPPVRGADAQADHAFFIADVWRTLRSVWHDRDLILSVFAAAYFLLLAAFLQMNLIPYGMASMELTQEQSGYLFLVAAVGIGVGSWMAGRISGRHVEFGIVPLGALGLAAGSILLGVLPPTLAAVLVLTAVMGVSAGLYIVPIHAFIQLRAPEDNRGRVIAASNFLGWVGVLASAALYFAFTAWLKLEPDQMFLILGLLTLALAVATLIVLPDFFARFVLIFIAQILYRIRVVNAEAVPTQGGALIVSNHVTWADAFLLGSTQSRRMRFVMDRGIYERSGVSWLLRLLGVITISEKDPPKQILASLQKARQALDEGYLVAIFAEGAITRTGMMRRFKGGFERIVRNSDYPVIPAYLGGAWGSVLSYYHGRLLGTLPRRFPYPVSIHFGEPMRADSTGEQIRQRIIEISTEYYDSLRRVHRNLSYAFIRAARKRWGKPCVSDVTGRELTFGRTLTGAVAMADALRERCGDQANVGILLPPSVAGVLANLAMGLLGKATVNLSYSAGPDARASAIEQTDLRTIITSRRFLDKLGLDEELPGLVYVEDILAQLDAGAKRRAFLKARLQPRRSLARVGEVKPDDVATILFSSGSTGRPKGVVLTHHNLLSNLDAMREVFRIHPTDKMCGVLPFFHAFGLSCTMWLPLTSGRAADYVPNPLDGKAVAKSVRQRKCTILIATPTFLLTYLRRAEREDFATLREVIVGAEKMKTDLADAFEEKFGVRPREGYGATELSPLVSLNVEDVEVGGVSQVGTKEGSVGHPVPGVAAKVVDPETFEPLGLNQPGLLRIKGPNVMQGYLHQPEKTARVIREGWYNTGDIAAIDDDGFITITDRLSRFSKIGGEMVPHIRVEEVLNAVAGPEQRVAAVTSLPDPRKGEELVVLYVQGSVDPDQLHEAVVNSGLPNLCKPRRGNYLPVDAIPVLGSGKLDLMRLKELAQAARERQDQETESDGLRD